MKIISGRGWRRDRSHSSGRPVTQGTILLAVAWTAISIISAMLLFGLPAEAESNQLHLLAWVLLGVHPALILIAITVGILEPTKTWQEAKTIPKSRDVL